MLSANWPYIVNFLILIVYFTVKKQTPAWPDALVIWAWIPYVAHLFIHNFVDGFQNTTRNIARIFLIQDHGVDYDPALVSPIQVALVPRMMTPVTLAWFAVHIGSFAVLLFFQGWGTALVAELALIGLGWVMPIDYQGHLKRIRSHAEKALNTGNVPDDLDERTLKGVYKVIDRAIRKKRNPQEWWATLLEDRPDPDDDE